MALNVKTITYSRGATVNRGNFNSDRIEVSVTVETDGRPEDEVFKEMREWVVSRVAAEVKAG